jgi:hypothetical protein
MDVFTRKKRISGCICGRELKLKYGVRQTFVRWNVTDWWQSRAVCSTFWIEVKVVSLSLSLAVPPPPPSYQPFGLTVACFRFSNLSETKHHEMWLRFSHSDIFCIHKASSAAIIFSGLASHYFSHVILLQKNVIWKTAVIRENTCQKLLLPLTTLFWCLTERYVLTCAKKDQLMHQSF